MPSYLLGGSSNSSGCCTDNSLDRNSAIFFNNLATKLLDMSKAIQKRMDDLANKVCAPQQAGFLFANIETPPMLLGIKQEFMEYIKRYGPPTKGKFDPEKLSIIRAELGISENDNVI